MGVLGLAKKDIIRPETARKLDELSCRQLAFTMSGIHEGLTAYDIYEIGGESDARLMLSTAIQLLFHIVTSWCLI